MYSTILLDGIQQRIFAGKPRSPDWIHFRKEVIVANPFCCICGSKEKLEVHHKQPYHLWPERELSLDNVCVMCDRPGASCHLRVGHLGDWSSYNPLVDLFLILKANRPRSRDEALWDECRNLLRNLKCEPSSQPSPVSF